MIISIVLTRINKTLVLGTLRFSRVLARCVPRVPLPPDHSRALGEQHTFCFFFDKVRLLSVIRRLGCLDYSGNFPRLLLFLRDQTMHVPRHERPVAALCGFIIV
jgi:hypothetical protein